MLDSELNISSRKSDLAKLQSYLVAQALQKKKQDLKINFHFKESLGDINLTDPLWKMPQKGVFTEDFNHDLLNNKTDLVVHSWKDLPTEKKNQLSVFATLPRADQRDLLIVKKSSLKKIFAEKKISLFSSSPRRFYNLDAFLKTHFPYGLDQINFQSVRGNIPTRMKKLIESATIDGLILAKAAVDRLLDNDFEDLAESKKVVRSILNATQWMVLPLSENPNAAAQGAIAIEIKADRSDLKNVLAEINDPATFANTVIERDLLASYGGGCHQKIGISCLSHKYGQVIFTKGLTDDGTVLRTQVLKNEHQKTIFKKFKNSELWTDQKSKTYFDRLALNYSLPESQNSPGISIAGVFIAKAQNIKPELLKNSLVWVSGVSTWKKCAELGVWVNGCQDNLGENFPHNLDAMTDGPVSWCKITHRDSPEHGQDPCVYSYQLERNTEKFNFKNETDQTLKKCFYWSSGSLFAAALNDHPEIRTAIHCCGPGATADLIEKKLGAGSLWNNLFIFYNQEQWRDYVTQ
jgi:hydroxymethylbilane synthase